MNEYLLEIYQTQYKQIGNAVPCNLALEVGKEIYKSLKELNDKI
ncbi:hypothetical protein [Mycoplasmopsis felis]